MVGRCPRARTHKYSAKPGADALVGNGSGGKVEVDEAVGLSGVADVVDVDAVVTESLGVRPALVPEQVATAQDDEGRREAAQGGCMEGRCVRVAVQILLTAVGGPVLCPTHATDDEPIKLNGRRMGERPRQGRVDQDLPDRKWAAGIAQPEG